MSYQAVIRNASNVLVANANVGMRISILQTTATGTVVYSERQTPTTNANGLATLEIGGGTVLSGNFTTINWANGPYFIKTETDPTGGTSYTISGTSQLLSVPFALYAASSGSAASNWTTTGNNIANNNSGNVGIGTGTTEPTALLTVKTDGIGLSQENASGTHKIGFFTNAANAWLQTHTNTDLSFTTNDGLTQMVLQKGTGNLGINTINPTEKLEVAGKTKTTNLQVTTAAGAGKVLTSDAIGNAAWATPSGGITQFNETNAYNLSTLVQGADVDFATTNVTVPSTGTYLITYFLDGYNTFTCSQCVTTPTPFVYYTTANLYNKTANLRYQAQTIDFLFTDDDKNGGASFDYSTLPAHQVSGSIVKQLTANDVIGFKMRSFADASPGGEIRIRVCNVTLVRLF